MSGFHTSCQQGKLGPSMMQAPQLVFPSGCCCRQDTTCGQLHSYPPTHLQYLANAPVAAAAAARRSSSSPASSVTACSAWPTCSIVLFGKADA